MKKITDKMISFCEEYIKNGFNGAKAYAIAYGQDNKQVCASEAYKLLKDKRILDEIEKQELGFSITALEAGITKEVIMKVLKDMLSAKKTNKLGIEESDYTARNNAILTYAKLTGQLTDKKKIELDRGDEAEVDVTKLTEEERKLLKEELLSSL